MAGDTPPGVRRGRGGTQDAPLVRREVTWRELAIRAPRLAQLKRRIELVRDDGRVPSFCANDHWYGDRPAAPGFRGQLAGLVGPDARPDDPILGTHAAYEVAAALLRALLPPCRECGCLTLLDAPVRRA